MAKKENIYRVPVKTKNFDATIKNGKSYTELLTFMTEANKEALKLLTDDSGILRCWGSVPGLNNNKLFDTMQEGDEILFYKDFKYIASATIAYTTDNPDMAYNLWGIHPKKGEKWELMYFLTNVKLVSVDRAIVNEAFGYKPNAIVQGLNRVSDETAKQFLEKYGSVAAFVDSVKPQEKAA